MSVIKWLLWPFSLIYWCITAIRNILFDKNILESKTFEANVICVGNLSVGGTGKSPMIEYLIHHLKDDYNIAVLSRGYKRKTKGFIEVLPDLSAAMIGDEPLQFKRKFPSIIVCVDADRRNGISTISEKYPETNLILLDDAFQHRKVKADFNILLTTFAKPFYTDYVLPMGRLRESRSGAERADVIIITKCPENINDSEKKNIETGVKPKEHQKIGFSVIKYDEHIFSTDETINFENFDDFYLITGIANPKPLVKYLNDNNKKFEHLAYPDHYSFSQKEINQFKNYKKPILTTEKDYVRLKGMMDRNLYYLPINISVDFDLSTFIKQRLNLN